MSTASVTLEPRVILRYSRWDALLVLLAFGHGLLLLAVPAAPVIAVGLWWNANTISHNFIHKPFFRSRALNRGLALYLTLLLGFPQSVWRERHLAHHAETAWQPRLTWAIGIELLLVAALWGTLLTLVPRLFLTVYLPGYVVGLGLCFLHGYYEHARGTVSHHGWLYNCLFFNDGYHVEHHARPGTHWTALREGDPQHVPTSRWPAILRWLDWFSLTTLEKWVLRSPRLQRFVLDRHERAFQQLLPFLRNIQQIGIVGGGLFPRTAIVLQRLFPDAKLTIIDADAEHLQTARRMLAGDVTYVHAWYDAEQHGGFDLLVVPLALQGDREAIYRQPAAPSVLVHDWLWRRRGVSAVVSLLLLKRVNLVQRGVARVAGPAIAVKSPLQAGPATRGTQPTALETNCNRAFE